MKGGNWGTTPPEISGRAKQIAEALEKDGSYHAEPEWRIFTKADIDIGREGDKWRVRVACDYELSCLVAEPIDAGVAVDVLMDALFEMFKKHGWPSWGFGPYEYRLGKADTARPQDLISNDKR